MLSNWLFWAIPVKYVQGWCLGLLFLLYIIPYLFGVYYTKMGVVVNLLWYDLIFYGWVRIKQKTGEDE